MMVRKRRCGGEIQEDSSDKYVITMGVEKMGRRYVGRQVY
jgi:hypothetical protein